MSKPWSLKQHERCWSCASDLEDTIFQVVEQTFCTYFFLEIMIRFGAFASKRRALMDPWFLFDAALVANMVVETWLVPIIIIAAGTDAADVLNISFLRMMRASARNESDWILDNFGMKEQYALHLMKIYLCMKHPMVSIGVHARVMPWKVWWSCCGCQESQGWTLQTFAWLMDILAFTMYWYYW